MMLTMGRATARLVVGRAAVSAADRLVDVGCGPGNAARAAARRGAQVTGVDPAPVMLRIARAVTPASARVTWAEGFAESLPLPDDSATIWWSLGTVHHWQDVGQGLAEAHRVLAPRGRMLTIERHVRAGATGLGSHGWTQQQADSFATQCTRAGFDDVVIERHDAGRRPMWLVTGARP
jgi:ubiquinone/menaquinone biosynthesis C-methylase UbiE